jgi:hypothetical protein
VLSYRVAVRSLDGGGSATREVAAADADASPAIPGRVAVQSFRVTNQGSGEDLIRVKATAAGGWTTTVGSDVLDVPAGETVTVPVYVTVPEGERGRHATTLTFTATSETDAKATVTRTAEVVPLPAPPPGASAPRASLRLAVSGRGCIRKGRLTLRLVSSVPLTRARVKAPRRRAITITGRAVTRLVRLRGLRGRRLTVRVSARAKSGTLLATRRTFRSCSR